MQLCTNLEHTCDAQVREARDKKTVFKQNVVVIKSDHSLVIALSYVADKT